MEPPSQSHPRSKTFATTAVRNLDALNSTLMVLRIRTLILREGEKDQNPIIDGLGLYRGIGFLQETSLLGKYFWSYSTPMVIRSGRSICFCTFCEGVPTHTLTHQVECSASQ